MTPPREAEQAETPTGVTRGLQVLLIGLSGGALRGLRRAAARDAGPAEGVGLSPDAGSAARVRKRCLARDLQRVIEALALVLEQRPSLRIKVCGRATRQDRDTRLAMQRLPASQALPPEQRQRQARRCAHQGQQQALAQQPPD